MRIPIIIIKKTPLTEPNTFLYFYGYLRVPIVIYGFCTFWVKKICRIKMNLSLIRLSGRCVQCSISIHVMCVINRCVFAFVVCIRTFNRNKLNVRVQLHIQLVYNSYAHCTYTHTHNRFSDLSYIYNVYFWQLLALLAAKMLVSKSVTIECVCIKLHRKWTKNNQISESRISALCTVNICLLYWICSWKCALNTFLLNSKINFKINSAQKMLRPWNVR